MTCNLLHLDNNSYRLKPNACDQICTSSNLVGVDLFIIVYIVYLLCARAMCKRLLFYIGESIKDIWR